MKRVTSQPILPQAGFEGALLRLLREYSDSINQAADHRLSEFVSITGSYTAGENDHIIKCAPSAPMTVTLPSAASMRNKRIVVKRTNDTTHIVTIQSTSGDIDNGATTLLTTAYQSKELFSDGSAWWLLDGCCNNPSGEVFSSIGDLIAGSAEIAGTATRLALHTATGAMEAQSATVDGVAEVNVGEVILLVQAGSGSSLVNLGSLGGTATITDGLSWSSGQQLFGYDTLAATQIMPNVAAFTSTGAGAGFARASGTAFTVESWFRWNSLPDTQPSSVLWDWDTPSSQFYSIRTTSTGGQLYVSTGAGEGNLGSPIAADTWHFLQLVVQTDDSFAIYLNGSSIGTSTFPGDASSGTWSFRIGGVETNNSTSATWWIGPTRVTRGVALANAVPTDLFPVP